MKLTWLKSNFQKMVLLELFLQMGIVELPNSVRCILGWGSRYCRKSSYNEKMQEKYIRILTCNYLSNDKEEFSIHQRMGGIRDLEINAFYIVLYIAIIFL